MTASKPDLASTRSENRSWGRPMRLIRWRLRRRIAERRYGKPALASAPILFGNSFPKSGTHLLALALEALPQMGIAVDRGMGPILTFEEASGRRRSASEIRSDLDQLQPGDVAFGHVIADPWLVPPLSQTGVAHFFMLRDLRDVVVSHAYFLRDKALNNVHHAYYKNLPDFDACLRASIEGRPDFPGEFPSLRSRFNLYLDWLDEPEVKVLRFEDFVADRRTGLASLLAFAEARGFRLAVTQEQALEMLLAAIDPQKSNTYRRGVAGDWRASFPPAIKSLFKDVAGDLLIRLGYEDDLDW